MKKLLFAIALILSCQAMNLRADERIAGGMESLAEKPHPRLLFTEAGFEAIKTKIALPENEALIKMHELVVL